MKMPPGIYEHVFENNMFARYSWANTYNDFLAPGILLACRQTHSEALYSYYSTASSFSMGYRLLYSGVRPSVRFVSAG